MEMTFFWYAVVTKDFPQGRTVDTIERLCTVDEIVVDGRVPLITMLHYLS